MKRQALRWTDAQRVTPRPNGPIAALALLVTDPRELDALVGIEALTNPLAREAAGILATIPPARRYLGARADLVMTPFVLPRASRFSDGAYGVLYVGDTINTALRETPHHQARRLAATKASAGTTVPMFSFSLHIDTSIIDARRRVSRNRAIYDPVSYLASQAFGRNVRSKGHGALHYDSVRNDGGECVALFWPDSVRDVNAGAKWRFYFDGTIITEYAQVI